MSTIAVSPPADRDPGLVMVVCSCGAEFSAVFGGVVAPSISQPAAERCALDEYDRHRAETGCP